LGVVAFKAFSFEGAFPWELPFEEEPYRVEPCRVVAFLVDQGKEVFNLDVRVFVVVDHLGYSCCFFSFHCFGYL